MNIPYVGTANQQRACSLVYSCSVMYYIILLILSKNGNLVLILQENHKCFHNSMALLMKVLLNLERRWCLPLRASAKSDSAPPAHTSALRTVLNFSLSSLDNLIPAFQKQLQQNNN